MANLSATGDAMINAYAYPTYASQSGIVRWNGSTNSFEIDCGTYTTQLTAPAITVTMNTAMADAVRWAERRMREEEKFLKIIEQHPEIKDMKDKLDLAIALVKDYD